MRRWRMKPDPMGGPRHGLVIFCLVFLFTAGLGTVFGPGNSNAVSKTLDDNVELIWGAMLTIGSGSTLLGMFWPWQVRDGLLLKRLGYGAMATAGAIFGIVVIGSAGLRGGSLTAGLVWFLTGMCIKEYRRVNLRIIKIKLHSQERS